MYRNRSLIKFALLPFSMLLLISSACTETSTEVDSGLIKPANERKEGKSLFHFDDRDLIHIKLNAISEHAGKPYSFSAHRQNGLWVFEPDGDAKKDLLANTSFIDHFMDTLSTVQLDEEINLGANRDVSRFGLNPAFFSFELTCEGGATCGKSTNILIGATADALNQSRYLMVPNLKGFEGKLFRVSGALIPMIEIANQAPKWRELRLLPFTPDSIDKISLTSGAKKQTWYRYGSDWVTGSEKGPVEKKLNIQSLLDRLTHLQIEVFPDASTNDDGDNGSAVKKCSSKKLAVIELETGNDTKVHVSLFKDQNIWAAIQSTGLNAVQAREGMCFGLVASSIDEVMNVQAFK